VVVMTIIVTTKTTTTITIHHKGRPRRRRRRHHLKHQKGSSNCEGKIKPGGLFRQNSMMCTPDQFIASDDNISALTECCFEPTT
jgi:hypothetical protein